MYPGVQEVGNERWQLLFVHAHNFLEFSEKYVTIAMFRVIIPQSVRPCFRQSSYVVRISPKLSHSLLSHTHVSLKQEQCSSIKTIHDGNDVFVWLLHSPDKCLSYQAIP